MLSSLSNGASRRVSPSSLLLSASVLTQDFKFETFAIGESLSGVSMRLEQGQRRSLPERKVADLGWPRTDSTLNCNHELR